eukprot:173357-Rhodomonas_salina.1
MVKSKCALPFRYLILDRSAPERPGLMVAMRPPGVTIVCCRTADTQSHVRVQSPILERPCDAVSGADQACRAPRLPDA